MLILLMNIQAFMYKFTGPKAIACFCELCAHYKSLELEGQK